MVLDVDATDGDNPRPGCSKDNFLEIKMAASKENRPNVKEIILLNQGDSRTVLHEKQQGVSSSLYRNIQQNKRKTGTKEKGQKIAKYSKQRIANNDKITSYFYTKCKPKCIQIDWSLNFPYYAF